MSRPDLYGTRARELAAAAGHDPDARVDNGAGKTMPIWCQFRAAARAEHNARTAAALVEKIATETARGDGNSLDNRYGGIVKGSFR